MVPGSRLELVDSDGVIYLRMIAFDPVSDEA
jgi:hypothetical protein